jgi:hypothetical protein
MIKFQEYLGSKRACSTAHFWAKDKTVEKAVKDCPRGDWMLYLGVAANIDRRQLMLARAHCVNTVRHLMQDKQSKMCVDYAIAYGEGRLERENLAACAFRPCRDYADSAADSLTSKLNSPVHSGCAASYAADSAESAGSTNLFTTAKRARRRNEKKTADICRKYIGQLIITAVNQKLNETSCSSEQTD